MVYFKGGYITKCAKCGDLVPIITIKTGHLNCNPLNKTKNKKQSGKKNKKRKS